MKHVVTLWEVGVIIGESGPTIISSCEGSECKRIQLGLVENGVTWIVWHDSGGYILHLSKHTCLNDAIDQYNEI